MAGAPDGATPPTGPPLSRDPPSDPVDLFSGGERVLIREAGFALKLLRPHAEPATVPPGQGQILVVLRGEASLRELGGAQGKVVMTERPDRQEALPAGTLFKVANDARWSVAGDAILLALSTSVPREVDRRIDLLALARHRPHMAPRLLFGNEAARVELVAARGRLPFRGWVPYRHRAAGPEIAVVLAGSFRARIGDLDRVLRVGELLRIPAGVPHSFAAAGRGICVGLVISGEMPRASAEVPLDRDRVRGFTPFGR